MYMFARAQEVFHQARLELDLVSTQDLRGVGSWAELNDLSAGTCNMGGELTAEQSALFRHRDGVQERDVVIYFVRSTRPPYNGCAVHPMDIAGATIAAGATEWTLAHELGHVLGLQHVDGSDRLMIKATRNLPAHRLPTLSNEEVAIVRANQLVQLHKEQTGSEPG